MRSSLRLKYMLLALIAATVVALLIDWGLSKEVIPNEVRTQMHNGTWYPEIRNAKKNSTIAVTTTFDDGYFYTPFTLRWISYAKKYNYDWYGINIGYAEIQFPTPHWHKAAVIFDLLSYGYEFVVFTDGDSVLVHPERTVEYFVKTSPPQTQLWISRDLSWATTEINTGLLIVRRGTWSLEMLKYTIRESGDSRIRPQDWPREQGSIDRWIRLSSKKSCKIFPYGRMFQIFSSFGDEPEKELEGVYQQNVWVMHFAGGYSESRHKYAQAVFNYSQTKYPV
mmetsp:Transcript_8626/g.53593  ORF Transcript_8626/g.53593 Transcript_8626/m.53593 type:complete len:280 (+) Transcript_8626:259-1098(+)